MRIALLALLLAACPGKPADHPKAADDSALRIKIAQLEASRGDGQNELIELATRGEQPAKLLALRGLGRVGGAKALATLGTALLDGDPEIVGTAAAAPRTRCSVSTRISAERPTGCTGVSSSTSPPSA